MTLVADTPRTDVAVDELKLDFDEKSEEKAVDVPDEASQSFDEAGGDDWADFFAEEVGEFIPRANKKHIVPADESAPLQQLVMGEDTGFSSVRVLSESFVPLGSHRI